MPLMPLTIVQNALEPMQIDAAIEDNDNNEEQPIIVENATLDLEVYANSYIGLARLYRLIFIADVCPPLQLEALKMGINYVQTTYNVGLYQLLHKKLNDLQHANHLSAALNAILPLGAAGDNHHHAAAGVANINGGGGAGMLPDVAVQPAVIVAGGGGGVGAPAGGNIVANGGIGVGGVILPTPHAHDMPVFDPNWVETKNKKAALLLEKLDSDLKNYKSNSIKESIRRGHDDLGDHYLNCGDLSNALKCYSRARDYCTSGKHVVNMCLNVIKVSLYLQNWSHVLSYVSKAESTPDFTESTKEANQAVLTRLKCAAGLAELQTKKYKSAAKHFLLASFDHCDFPEMLSPSNVAMYGGLCALATFDRQELQKNVIGSSSFKLFLELEPQLRDIIFKFYESKYASCLTLLDEIRDNLLVDMYIAPHTTALYTKIRNRALIQYFSPYLSADMHKMAVAFNCNVTALENEVMQLILDGQIQARIDSHNKILYAKEADQRNATFERALTMAKDYQRRTRMLVLRAAVIKNHIHVKSIPRDTVNHSNDLCTAPGSSTSSNIRN